MQLPFYHDPSLFFDDDGSVFVIYGGGEISYVELNSDASGVKQGGRSGKLNGVNAETAAGHEQFYRQARRFANVQSERRILLVYDFLAERKMQNRIGVSFENFARRIHGKNFPAK